MYDVLCLYHVIISRLWALSTVYMMCQQFKSAHRVMCESLYILTKGYNDVLYIIIIILACLQTHAHIHTNTIKPTCAISFCFKNIWNTSVLWWHKLTHYLLPQQQHIFLNNVKIGTHTICHHCVVIGSVFDYNIIAVIFNRPKNKGMNMNFIHSINNISL